MDTEMILKLNWEAVRRKAPKSFNINNSIRMAGDNIEILRTTSGGQTLEARAFGRVYIDWTSRDVIRVACREAYYDRGELLVRGRPTLIRGGSIIEGLDDATLIYFIGSRMKILGRHRVTTPAAVIAESEARRRSRNQRPSTDDRLPFPPLPETAPSFTEFLPSSGLGPNPLLPALSTSLVPEEVRKALRADPQEENVPTRP